MKNYFFLLSLLLIILTSSACKDDNAEPEVCGPTNPYENCCGIAPLEAEFDNVKIYVPNIMTPNGDGINDVFFLFTNSIIIEIESLTISKDNETIFELLNFQAGSNFIWDGTDDQGNVVSGLFDVQFKAISNSNMSESFTTKICVFPCPTDGFPTENLTNCGFGSQHNGQGEFDPFSPSLESNCF